MFWGVSWIGWVLRVVLALVVFLALRAFIPWALAFAALAWPPDLIFLIALAAALFVLIGLGPGWRLRSL